MTRMAFPVPVVARKLWRRWVKGYLRDVAWQLYGRRLHNPHLDWHQASSFLFICKGNICRSPFAHHMAARLLEHRQGIVIASSGLQVKHPISSPALAVEAAAKFDIDLNTHRSQQLARSQIEQSDIIVAMEVWQWRMLIHRFPAHRSKMMLLALADPEEIVNSYGFERCNISDPYGKAISEYIRCYQRITNILQSVLTMKPVSENRTALRHPTNNA